MNCENNCAERVLYEALMVKFLLLNPNLIPKCQLQPENFLSPAFRNIFREVRNLYAQGATPGPYALMPRLSEEEQRIVLATMAEVISKDKEYLFNRLTEKLK